MAVASVFGNFIRTERLKKGVSMREFASAVGLSEPFVSRMERGEVAPPSEGKIQNIASFFAIEPDHLVIMARKLPEGIKEMLFERPLLAPFLRSIAKKSDEELDRLLAE